MTGGYDKSGSDHMAGKLTPTHSFAFVSNFFSSVGIFHCMRLVVFLALWKGFHMTGYAETEFLVCCGEVRKGGAALPDGVVKGAANWATK
jgi:hypothetical protein